MKTLQRALDDTARRLRVQAPIVVTPGLLNLTLSLGFLLDHRDNWGMGLHQFGLSRHTSTARKVLRARANQHQIVVGGAAAPSLAEAAMLMDPDWVSFPSTLSWGTMHD